MQHFTPMKCYVWYMALSLLRQLIQLSLNVVVTPIGCQIGPNVHCLNSYGVVLLRCNISMVINK